MTESLPKGWAEAELGTVLSLANGFAFKPSHWGKAGLPIIRIQNLNNPDAPFNYYDGTLPERVRVKNGDLLFAWSGTPGTSFGAHIWNGGDAWLNQHIFKVSFDHRLFDKTFLKYAINRNLDRYIAQAHGGAGLAHITKGMFETSTLQIAPLSEQKRIALRFEDLLAKFRNSQEHVTSISAFLRRFRQSVLSAACSGRLTADWRESHDDAQGTTFRLRQICERRLKAELSAKRRETTEDLYSAIEENVSDTLPQGWAFTYLNKLAQSFDYGTSSKSAKEGKVPVLRMGNIQGGSIDWGDLVFTSDAEEIEKYALEPNTVLFNRTNSPELVGKTAIYRGERPAIFAGYLIRINAVPELDPEYLNLCLNSPAAREFCSRVKTDGVSQSNINAQKLGMFEVPFCSLAEQKEIVRRVNGLFMLADKIETRYKVVQQQVNRLPQSILAKAFGGELVPTEAELAAREGRTYESAEQLLQRIQAAGRQLHPEKKMDSKRTSKKTTH